MNYEDNHDTQEAMFHMVRSSHGGGGSHGNNRTDR
jgi:hypothetical protein